MATRLAWMLVVLVSAGCGEPDSDVDAGVDGGAVRDGGPPVEEMDAQVPADAGWIDSGTGDAGTADGGTADGGTADAGTTDGGTADAGMDGGADANVPTADAGRDAGSPDAGDGVLDVRVLADAFCADLSFDPPSISVPAGTSFTVRWINATGCTEIDIDMNGTVPIVLGLEPGESHHDSVRQWCGIYTGTYVFRAYYAPSFPYYLDVDCAG